MADRFCPNCGTEVEADARFCPSCGTTLESDREASEIPAAPPWPDAAADEPTLVDAAVEAPAEEPPEEPYQAEIQLDEPVPAAQLAESEPLAEPQPLEPPAEPPAAAPPPAAEPSAPPPPPPPTGNEAPRASAAADLPFTWPTTLSGWLIGAGSLVGAVFLVPRLTAAGSSVSWLLLLALLGVAATVFLPDRIPDIPRLRLWILVTTMIGLGVGLARAAFTIQGVDTLFLVSMLAAAGGALLIELEMDRPFPPPDREG